MNNPVFIPYLIAALFALLYIRSVTKVIRWRKTAEAYERALKFAVAGVLVGSVGGFAFGRRLGRKDAEGSGHE